MRKISLLIFFVFFTNHSFSQTTFEFYKPNGEKLPYNTLEEIKEVYKNEYLTSNFVYDKFYSLTTRRGIYQVFYYAFTNKAAYLVCDNPILVTFNEAINAFDLNKFLNSDEFSIYLDQFISKGNFPEYIITQSLGKPSKKTTKNNGKETISFLYYKNPRVIFKSVNHYIVSYEISQ